MLSFENTIRLMIVLFFAAAIGWRLLFNKLSPDIKKAASDAAKRKIISEIHKRVK